MRANMSKMDPETGKAIRAVKDDPSGEPEGKVLKGSAYIPPNLHPILAAQHNYGVEDDTVYRVSHLPLTLGEGGPRIGEAALRMDHNGNMHIDALVEDTEVLPQIQGLSILDVYVEPPVMVQEGTPVEEKGYDGPPMIAQLQEGLPDHERRPVVDLEQEEIKPEFHSLFTETRYESGMPSGIHIFPPYDR